MWQRHAKRLARSGQIKEIAGAFLRPRRELTFEESMQTYEVGAWFSTECTALDQLGEFLQLYLLRTQVLAEILQQGARIDDPDAAARQEFVRCAHSGSLTCFAVRSLAALCSGVLSVTGCLLPGHVGVMRCLLAWRARLLYARLRRAT